MIKSKLQNRNYKVLSILILFYHLCPVIRLSPAYAQDVKRPTTVNGDNVEYSTDNKTVSAEGNVSITYGDSRLTCEKLTINTETKDAEASGNVKLDDSRGIITGEKLKYNFQNKTGLIINAGFRANPYFGKAEELEKVSDYEYIAANGYVSTCSYDFPHYRMKAKKIRLFPQERLEINGVGFKVGQKKQYTLLYLPGYKHNLKDPFMHVQVMPGRKKDWGPYLLTAWRYNLTDNLSGRLYSDYRSKLGPAEGFGANYKSEDLGKGDLKFYYTQERPKGLPEGSPAEFQRYFIRWRHKWDISERTNVSSEYFKIEDAKRGNLGVSNNFLKDYFPREYEKDMQPLSYTQLHHAFDYSSFDFLLQKRTNRWFTQLEKLPEVKYTLPSVKLGSTPFLYENSSSIAQFNYKYASPSASTSDIEVSRIDTTNKISIPMRLAFIGITPFAADRQTYYSKDINGSAVSPRTIFYTGADVSTKFYKVYNTASDFLGLDINGLRHIITPSIGYSYNRQPTVSSAKLKQIDAVDSITQSNAANLELLNKLQTKRNGRTVDVLNLRATTSYIFKPKSGDKSGSNLSDLLLDMELLPYSWLRIDTDAAYKHSGLRSDPDYKHFTNVNYDFNFSLSRERSFAVGQRYQRQGGNEITDSFDWRLTPKWKIHFYHRHNIKSDSTIEKGLREQEYTLSRDLHCWNMDFTYNYKRGEGATFWLIFRLKAFPEVEFGFDQSYHKPSSGSQTNP